MRHRRAAHRATQPNKQMLAEIELCGDVALCAARRCRMVVVSIRLLHVRFNARFLGIITRKLPPHLQITWIAGMTCPE